MKRCRDFPELWKPGPAMFGPDLVEHTTALGREFGVELLPFVHVPGGRTFVFPLRGFEGAFLIIEAEDQGPHPDRDGSRSTRIKPRLAAPDADLYRTGFRLTGWGSAPVARALDAIALLYIDAKAGAPRGRAC